MAVMDKLSAMGVKTYRAELKESQKGLIVLWDEAEFLRLATDTGIKRAYHWDGSDIVIKGIPVDTEVVYFILDSIPHLCYTKNE